jgi:hypothetical protein
MLFCAGTPFPGACVPLHSSPLPRAPAAIPAICLAILLVGCGKSESGCDYFSPNGCWAVGPKAAHTENVYFDAACQCERAIPDFESDTFIDYNGAYTDEAFFLVATFEDFDLTAHFYGAPAEGETAISDGLFRVKKGGQEIPLEFGQSGATLKLINLDKDYPAFDADLEYEIFWNGSRLKGKIHLRVDHYESG